MTTNSVNVNIPKKDMPFFRKFSKNMGWTFTDAKPEAFDSTDCDAYREAMKDVKEGRVYHAESVEQMMAQILS